ncbi:MAG: type ISP restriction/modification enzyme [Candidatus Edwardsbacteria bacterium]
MSEQKRKASVENIYQKYLSSISDTYLKGDAREESYYPYLKEFVEGWAQSSQKFVGITVQPKKTLVGIPDFLLRGERNKIIGYIEAKPPETRDLSEIAESDQLKRYRNSLPNVLLTNFLEFQIYRNGKLVNEIHLARPFTLLQLKHTPTAENVERFNELLEQFLSFSIPPTYTAKALATELAKRTTLLRNLISEELTHNQSEILGFFRAFKEELIESLTEEKFADMYAQTITYGLFSARMRAKDKEFSRDTAYRYIPKETSLLRHLFYSICGANLPESLEWIVDDISNVLAEANLSSIFKELHTLFGYSDDPIIPFYETFLTVYNPKERERLGVYYTPASVVSYIARSIHHLLKKKFHKSEGLADRGVTLLDPAAGTLTFPAMAIRIMKEELDKKGKAGLLPSLIREHILKDFYAFEILVAPYAIGHFKIALVLEDLGYCMGENERFQFYLTNTLEMKEPKHLSLIPDLTKEGQRAKEIKEKIPVLVVLGNPPYSVSSENKSEFIEKLMEDYKKDVRCERNLQPLSDDYIKFLRFAQWKIEQAGCGLVGMITNNSYLSGLIHRGMRKKLLESFNEIYILNLHGNSRIGEKCPDGSKDENVFDIMQGVSIALFIKHNRNFPIPPLEKGGKEGFLGKVFYQDVYGLREKKYEYLNKHDVGSTKWKKLLPSEPYYFFVEKDFSQKAKYDKFFSVQEIFVQSSSGVKTHRDHFIVGFTKEEIKQKMQIFTGNLPDELVTQSLDLKDTRDWKIKIARESLKEIDWKKYIRPYSYRPFDNRYICYLPNLIDRGCDRWNLMKNFFEENLSLVTTSGL